MQEAVVKPNSPYSDHFRGRRKERRGEPVWLIERRTAAIQEFEAHSFPSRRDEAWRNVDLSPISNAHFPTVHVAGDADHLAESLSQIVPDAHRLVLIDGHLSESHSDLGGLPSGVTVRAFGHAIEEADPLLGTHLARQVSGEGHAFAALNTAFFEDGALIHVARGVEVERPIVVAYLNSAEAEGRAVYPRTLIVAEDGAQVRIAEFHQSVDVAYLCAPVTEIVVRANAGVHYYKVQEEGPRAFHFGAIAGIAERDARLSVHCFASGGKLARTDITADLAGLGAQVELDGLYLVGEGQYIDHHTYVTHLTEHGHSHQLFKGVLSGKCEAVFDGLVKVAKGAQKTDARQENRNLLLSKRALVHSNPRLEIHADDVKCSHGSSVGELDQDAVFYLRSRGIGQEDAQGLLTYAFIGEVIEPIRIEALREYERQAALRRLPGHPSGKDML
jgi:Fe-S cluster assembly protein SufD